MKYYHASNHDYDFPSYEELIKNRTNHANGNLGLWMSAKKDWIEGFGNNIYELVITEKDIKVLPVAELFNWEKSFKSNNYENKNEELDLYYKELRLKLMKEYKAVVFEENSGDIAMGIVLDFSVIKEFNKLDLAHKSKLKI